MFLRLLAVALLALSANAQTVQFSLDRNFGSPAGGDTIRVTAYGPIDFRSGRVEVTFDGQLSLQVTVTGAQSLSVLTPPHREGIAAIEVIVGGSRYPVETPFGYIVPREPLLIPVAIETAGVLGAQWTTDISVYNDDVDPVNLMPEVCFFIGRAFPCGQAVVVPAKRSIRVPPRIARLQDTWFEMYLYPPDAKRGQLHFNVRARDKANPSDAGTEIPVVPASRFRQSKLVLNNVPVSDRHRALLRLYTQDFSNGAPPIHVRVFDESTQELLLHRDSGARLLPTDNPLRFSYSYGDLLVDPAVRGHAAVRIEIEVQGSRLWAMLTLTEYATQRITVITSQ